jgi:glycosyltransferase involved in cell wall biosynthesis
MPSSPPISVIIPAYNSASFISVALDSVLAQTHLPDEILVIDDGSTDNTAEVVTAYPPPVRLIRQKNGGPARARNAAAVQAKGEWFAFLDSDDAWRPAKLERQLTFTSDPKVGIVHNRIRGLYTEGVPDRVDFKRLWERNCISASSVLIRREAFLEAGMFPEDLTPTEDYYLWMRVASKGWSIVTCQEELSVYTPTPNSISRNVISFARAHLKTIERTGREMSLPPGELQEKMLQVYDHHAMAAIHCRNIPAARQLLREALGIGISPRRLKLWLAAMIPVPILNLRRRFTSRPDRSE